MTAPQALQPKPAKRIWHQVRPGGRVLVLGGGFIGAHIAHRLVRSGYHVDVLTRSAPRAELQSLFEGAVVELADVMPMLAVARILPEVDHVVYAVGSSSPVESDLDPASDVALVLPPVVRLLELLRSRPSVGLTYISSGGAVYGTVSTLASEAMTPTPISSYGILKMSVEQYLTMYTQQFGVSTCAVRVSNAYGPGQPWAKGQGIVARLLRSVATGERFPVFGEGEHVRDYVYVEDVATAVAGLLAAPDAPPVVNVGSGMGYSIMEVVEAVEKESGQRIDVEFMDPRPFDVRSIVLDIRLLRSIVDYEPIDLFEGVARTWRDFAEQRSLLERLGAR